MDDPQTDVSGGINYYNNILQASQRDLRDVGVQPQQLDSRLGFNLAHPHPITPSHQSGHDRNDDYRLDSGKGRWFMTSSEHPTLIT